MQTLSTKSIQLTYYSMNLVLGLKIKVIPVLKEELLAAVCCLSSCYSLHNSFMCVMHTSNLNLMISEATRMYLRKIFQGCETDSNASCGLLLGHCWQLRAEFLPDSFFSRFSHTVSQGQVTSFSPSSVSSSII